ncbi:hypothetical protein [Nocardia sp. NPDC020380]|uniref:hypothetical protein n=1 Tax=Nocardia sp. NPDC020380 TaxID=3364309 RepID=UPI0037A71DC9
MDTTSRSADALAHVLHAQGPHPDHVGKLALFGQFVGSWRVTNRLRDADGDWTSYPGRWDFGWTLGGLAIQDVLDCPTAPNRYPGTTIRCYVPATDSWNAVWLDPHSGLHVTLQASSADTGIVLEGSTQLGSSVRWNFSNITDTSFHWQGYLARNATSYELVQEMAAHRLHDR